MLLPLAPALTVFNFRIHRITLEDPEIPKSIDNCTKDEERCDFLLPPQKQITQKLSIHSGYIF